MNVQFNHTPRSTGISFTPFIDEAERRAKELS